MGEGCNLNVLNYDMKYKERKSDVSASINIIQKAMVSLREKMFGCIAGVHME